MKLRLLHLILHENGQCLLGTKKLEIMLNLGAKFFLSLTNTFSVIVNVNPCQIWTGNTQISFFNFFQQNLVHYQYYKNAPILWSSILYYTMFDLIQDLVVLGKIIVGIDIWPRLMWRRLGSWWRLVHTPSCWVDCYIQSLEDVQDGLTL